jgi:folate-binding protein YgfZ
MINSKPNLFINDKYKYSIPDGATDMIQNRSIPIEFGAEELNAISYNKGCYIGQEVVSRAKYQGVIRKKIFKLEFTKNEFGTDIANIATGAEITDLECKIKLGVYCSGVQGLAIALLREEKIKELKLRSLELKELDDTIFKEPKEYFCLVEGAKAKITNVIR